MTLKLEKPQGPEINEYMVRALEGLLAQVRRGDVYSLAFASIDQQGNLTLDYSALDEHVALMHAGAERIRMNLNDVLFADEEEEV